jgi:type I restriction enzyme, S subunit
MSSAWPDVALGDICSLNYGKSLPEARRVPGEVPVFGSNGQIGSHDVAITNGATIIVGRKGSFGEVHFSAVSCWPIDTTYYIDQAATQADLEWLGFRLKGLGLTRLNRAAAVPGLNREDAYRVRLSLPPLAEQRRIAVILGRAEALRARRRAALRHFDALIGAMFLDVFGDPVLNTKAWPSVRLLDVAAVTFGFPFDSASFSTEGALPVVRIRDVVRGRSTTFYIGTEPFTEAHRVRDGDILVGMDGEYNCARWSGGDAVLNQRVCRFAPVSEDLNDEYLFHFLPRVLKRIEAETPFVTVKHLSARQLGAIRVPLPPVHLQQEFAARAHMVEQLRRRSRTAIVQIDELLATLQRRAFRGEL